MSTEKKDLKQTSISFAELWHKIVEEPMIRVGLMERPGLRFLVVSGITAVILHLTRPAKIHTNSESPSLFAPISGIRKDWIALSLLAGTMSVLFI